MDKLAQMNLPEAEPYYNKAKTAKKKFHCWVTTSVDRGNINVLTGNSLARVTRQGKNYLVLKMPLGILQPEMSGYQGNVYVSVKG